MEPNRNECNSFRDSLRFSQSYVDKVASENQEMKVKLAKMEKEKKQWEEGLKKKEEEMKRRRKREEVRWKAYSDLR